MPVADTAPAARAEPDGCPVCGERDSSTAVARVRDYEYGAPGEYDWQRCRGCGLIRLVPFPTAEVLQAAYPPDYHAYVEPQSALSRYFIARSRAAQARAVARSLPPGGTVLDVGCSSGLLLAEIGKLGTYRLLGVEYAAAQAAAAEARGIQVWRGDVETAPFAPSSVDLVTLQHVVEHVLDPAATIAAVARLLKPGGKLLGELPNWQSWDRQLFSRYWGGGHAPRHLWHFSPDNLRRLLAAHGFTEIAVRPTLHTGHWALSIQNFLRRARTDTSGLRSGRAWHFPLLLLATVPVNCLQMLLSRTGVMRFQATLQR